MRLDMREALPRREWIRQMSGSAAAILLGACRSTTPPPLPVGPRLTARPTSVSAPLASGAHPLGLSTGRDGLLYVPTGYDVTAGVPLIVMLHGLGGGVAELDKISATPVVPSIADQFGVALLLPETRGAPGTQWVSTGNFDPDRAFIDAALAQTFDRLNVRPDRVALWGFSDGASYSLSLGLCNGDLFSQVVAFSPEYMRTPAPVGKPRVFVSHGRQDPFIPVTGSRDGIVRQLRSQGYTVDYVEFDGDHTIPPQARSQAMNAFLA
jgi:predicted esterase